MKKKIVLILISSIMLLLAACSNSSKNSDTTQSESIDSQPQNYEEESASTNISESDSLGESEYASENISEANSQESSTEPVQLSTDEFISEVSKIIDGSVGTEDSIDDISLENGNLLIHVTLGDPSPFSYEDLMISRTSSITDQILYLEDGFDLWETITIDFGEHGSIQNGHDNMQDDGYGAYFLQENFVITTN